MKVFGSGGKHKKSSADPANSEYSGFDGVSGYSGYEEEPAFNEYGETEDQVNAIIAGYRKKKHRRVVIVLVILALLAAGGITAYSVFIKPPDLIQAPPRHDDTPASPGADNTAAPVEDEEPQEYIDNGYRKEYRYTFLVLGVDQIKSNTDTILVGTLDVKDHWLHVVSIPRDTLVNVPWGAKKINTVYASSQLGYDGWDYDDGIDGLKKELVDIMGYEPDCWAIIDIVAFKELVDAIGGVYYDVPVDMNYIDPDQDLVIDIKAGYQWLSGEEALKVVRFRSGYAMADIGRIGTQQDFIKSIASQMLDLGNIPNIGKVYDVYEQYVDTNLSVGTIAWFVKEFL